MKKYVIIQKMEKDKKFDSYCFPGIGFPSGVSPEKYVVRVDGRNEEFLSPSDITLKYGDTHAIWYFEHINDLLKFGI